MAVKATMMVLKFMLVLNCGGTYIVGGLDVGFPYPVESFLYVDNVLITMFSHDAACDH